MPQKIAEGYRGQTSLMEFAWQPCECQQFPYNDEADNVSMKRMKTENHWIKVTTESLTEKNNQPGMRPTHQLCSVEVRLHLIHKAPYPGKSMLK